MVKTIEASAKALQSMSHEDHAQAHGGHRPVLLYDFEICDGAEDLSRTIHHINRYGYKLITVTQNKDEYTVFFRRSGT